MLDSFASLSQMLSGMSDVWLAVVYVAGMFALLAFRRDMVLDRDALLRSHLLFAAFLVVIPLANLLAFFLAVDDSGRRAPDMTTLTIMHVATLLSRVLYAVSIVVGLRALLMSPAEVVGEQGEGSREQGES